jgi:hypothetical protein
MVAGLAQVGIWNEIVGDAVRCRPPGRLSTDFREQPVVARKRWTEVVEADVVLAGSTTGEVMG